MSKNVPGMNPVPVEEATAGLIKTLQDAPLEKAPAFYNYDGTTIPW